MLQRKRQIWCIMEPCCSYWDLYELATDNFHIKNMLRVHVHVFSTPKPSKSERKKNNFFFKKKTSRVDHFQKIRFSFGAVHNFCFSLHPVGGHLDLCCLAFSISFLGIYRDVNWHWVISYLHSFCTDED